MLTTATIFSALCSTNLFPVTGSFGAAFRVDHSRFLSRAMLFEQLYKTADPKYDGEAVDTFASRLRLRLLGSAASGSGDGYVDIIDTTTSETDTDRSTKPADFLSLSRDGALRTVRSDPDLSRALEAGNATWGVVWHKLRAALPETIEDCDELANQPLPEFLDGLFGKGNWHTEKRLTKKGNKSPSSRKARKAKPILRENRALLSARLGFFRNCFAWRRPESASPRGRLWSVASLTQRVKASAVQLYQHPDREFRQSE